MAIDNLVNFADYTDILTTPLFEQVAMVLITIIGGVVIAKIVGRIIKGINTRFRLNIRTMDDFARLSELFIFIISIIVALNILEVNAAQVIIQSTLLLLPSIITLLLLLFLGAIIVNLLVDITKAALLKVGFEDYLKEVGVSISFLNSTFMIIKVFLFLLVVSASLNYIGMGIPFIDSILLGLIYAAIIFSVAVGYFTFKEPISNFFLGNYIQQNLLKPGQNVKIGEEVGEVIGIMAQGTLIKTNSGYDVLIPNKEIVKKKIYLKRTKQDIGKLESIRSNYVSQLPAYCGPASATMMLSFWGYETDQEKVGKLAKTKVPGGTGPKNLIKAVRTVTNNKVSGALVQYDEINNLKDEIKGWISEGALVILWFSKPVVFKGTGAGHFVLCIGIEGDELIIMDPSVKTAGVYLVDFRLFEEAMAEHDKKRGYVVFAERSTPAHWRISEGLIYTDVSAYQGLSKGFERYLKRLIRKNETMHEMISEAVFMAMKGKKRKIKAVWKPKEHEEEEI